MESAQEFKILGTVLKKYLGSGSSVRVPEGVEEISSFAFRYKKLSEVILPAGLKKINDCAFYGCEKLRHVEFPESLEYIGAGAFIGCSELREISLPPHLERIEGCAFENCRSLRRVDIPEWTEFVGEFAFKGCGDITVNIPGDTDAARLITDRTASVYAPGTHLYEVPEEACFSFCLGACRSEKPLRAEYREYIREHREQFLAAAGNKDVLSALIDMKLLSEGETEALLSKAEDAAAAGMLLQYKKDMFRSADPFAEFDF